MEMVTSQEAGLVLVRFETCWRPLCQHVVTEWGIAHEGRASLAYEMFERLEGQDVFDWPMLLGLPSRSLDELTEIAFRPPIDSGTFWQWLLSKSDQQDALGLLSADLRRDLLAPKTDDLAKLYEYLGTSDPSLWEDRKHGSELAQSAVLCAWLAFKTGFKAIPISPDVFLKLGRAYALLRGLQADEGVRDDVDVSPVVKQLAPMLDRLGLVRTTFPFKPYDEVEPLADYFQRLSTCWSQIDRDLHDVYRSVTLSFQVNDQGADLFQVIGYSGLAGLRVDITDAAEKFNVVTQDLFPEVESRGLSTWELLALTS